MSSSSSSSRAPYTTPVGSFHDFSTPRSRFEDTSSDDASSRLTERLEIFNPKGGTQRKRGSYSSSSTQLPTPQTKFYKKESKKELTIPNKLPIYFLLEGQRAPATEIAKLELVQNGQFIESFVFEDRNHLPIPKHIFENEVLFKLQEPLGTYFRRGAYGFFQQIDKKLPVRTNYSDKNFPTLDAWVAFSNDSRKKIPLIVAPTEI